jgi:hypothetical protein
VFLPAAIVPGDMVALARLGADGPASRDILRNEGGPIIFRASMTHARNTLRKRNDFVVKTSEPKLSRKTHLLGERVVKFAR